MKKNLTAYEKKAWQLVIICVIAYTTVYIGKKNINVCLPDMIADGICNKTEGGTIGTCFLALYALGQFVNGWLGEKIQPRFMIAGGLFLAGVANVMMSLAPNAVVLMVIWGVCGFCCSMLWPPIIRAVSTWTSTEISQASAAGLSVTIPVGTILADIVCAVALGIAGWRAAFASCGAILMIVAVILYFGFLSLKSHTVDKVIEKSSSSNASASGKASSAALGGVLCAGIIFAAVGVFFNGMLKDGLDLWLPTVLSEKYVLDASVVSVIVTVLPLFNIAGVYIAQYLFRRFNMTELGCTGLMFLFSTVAVGIVLTLMKFAGGGIVNAIVVTILLAVSSASMLGANTMLLTFIPLHFSKIGRASFLSGTLNCFSYGAAAVSSIAIGAVSQSFGWEGVFIAFTLAALLGSLFTFGGRNKLAEKTRALDALDADTPAEKE